MARAGIALGSNLGDRHANLCAALGALRAMATPGAPVLTAPIYQTSPRDCPPGSPDFFNTVIEMGFDGGSRDLLDRTRALETHLGRFGGCVRNAPRVIDIDLLYVGDEIICDETLVLPHPRLGERRFVLQPLADIRSDLVLPGQSLSIAERLGELPPGEAPLVRVADALI